MSKLTIADIERMDRGRLAQLSREELAQFALGTLEMARALVEQLEQRSTGWVSLPSSGDWRGCDEQGEAGPSGGRFKIGNRRGK